MFKGDLKQDHIILSKGHMPPMVFSEKHIHVVFAQLEMGRKKT